MREVLGGSHSPLHLFNAPHCCAEHSSASPPASIPLPPEPGTRVCDRCCKGSCAPGSPMARGNRLRRAGSKQLPMGERCSV